MIGAKARALLHGRHHVSVKDIQALAKPILRHRVHPELLRRSRRHHLGSHRRSAARRGAAARQRSVEADMAGHGALSRPGDHRAAGHDRSQGADDRRRLPDRAASQPVQGVQRRVRRVPAVPARRRSGDARLEGLRAHPTSTSSRSSRKRPTSTCHILLDVSALDGLRLGRGHQAANTRRTSRARWPT